MEEIVCNRLPAGQFALPLAGSLQLIDRLAGNVSTASGGGGGGKIELPQLNLATQTGILSVELHRTLTAEKPQGQFEQVNQLNLLPVENISICHVLRSGYLLCIQHQQPLTVVIYHPLVYSRVVCCTLGGYLRRGSSLITAIEDCDGDLLFGTNQGELLRLSEDLQEFKAGYQLNQPYNVTTIGGLAGLAAEGNFSRWLCADDHGNLYEIPGNNTAVNSANDVLQPIKFSAQPPTSDNLTTAVTHIRWLTKSHVLTAAMNGKIRIFNVECSGGSPTALMDLVAEIDAHLGSITAVSVADIAGSIKPASNGAQRLLITAGEDQSIQAFRLSLPQTNTTSKESMIQVSHIDSIQLEEGFPTALYLETVAPPSASAMVTTTRFLLAVSSYSSAFIRVYSLKLLINA